MQDLIKYAFDFFAHVLPGLVILLALSLINSEIETLENIQNAFTAKRSTGETTIIVIVAYAVGFAIYPFGRWLYRTVGFKIWGKNVKNKVDMFLSDKYVLIREKSEINFQYIESWNIYCAMSHNFAMAALVFFGISVYKAIAVSTDKWIWAVIALSSLFMFFVFLYRAVKFYHWARHDLNATVKYIKNND